MKKFTICIILFLSVLLAKAQESYKKSLTLMGCDFAITVVASSKEEANEHIKVAIDEIKRIEKLISSWDKHSQTSLINANAGVKPVNVDPELVELVERSLHISKLTSGAFDISFASVDKIWKFDKSTIKMPPSDQIKSSVAKIGFDKIIIDKANNTVFLKEKGMKIGFGAIGKGYAADKAKELLKKRGVTGGIINASGDLTTWGKQPNGESWKVGIKNPLNKENLFSWFDLDDNAVVTSGSYEKYVMIDGERYAHIINPKTGMPSKGIISVSVFAPKAELADALATSVFVLGVEVGLDLINQLKGIEVIVVDSKGRVYYSKNIKKEKK